MPARRALVIASLLLFGVGAMAGCGGAAPVRVRITIHYSHFDPMALTVPHGVPITFTLVNTDPIDHEWIVGDEALHQRHRTGTEPYHNARSTEVTILALSTKTTTVTFATPGTLKYICHVPGHEAFGMVGTLTVT